MAVQVPLETEITYDRGREFLGHEFKNILIEYEYSILDKPETAGNTQVKYITKGIHQVLDNLVRTFKLNKSYVDGDDTWKGILAAESFAVHYIFHTTSKKIPGQLLFGLYNISPIEQVTNWRLIYKRKQTLFDKNTDR